MVGGLQQQLRTCSGHGRHLCHEGVPTGQQRQQTLMIGLGFMQTGSIVWAAALTHSRQQQGRYVCLTAQCTGGPTGRTGRLTPRNAVQTVVPSTALPKCCGHSGSPEAKAHPDGGWCTQEVGCHLLHEPSEDGVVGQSPCVVSRHAQNDSNLPPRPACTSSISSIHHRVLGPANWARRRNEFVICLGGSGRKRNPPTTTTIGTTTP